MSKYEEMGHELALKMALIDGVYEPTLAKVQEDAELSVHADENLKNIPAWKIYSESYLGLPEHYFAVQRLTQNNNLTSRDDDDLQLPSLPYSLLNHGIQQKLLITLNKGRKKLPSLHDLCNGTIIITSHSFPADIKYNIEIFLHMHNELIPCCFASLDEVIIDCPLSPSARVRCYFVEDSSAIDEATFIDSDGSVIYHCDYESIYLHGSSSYGEICEAIIKSN